MKQGNESVVSHIAGKIENFSGWLYRQLKRNQAHLDSLNTDEAVEDFADSLRAFLNIK